MIFCDNWNVVRKTNVILRGCQVIHPLMPDHDLWLQIQHLVSGRSQQFQVLHVYSHQNLGNLHGLEHWVCQGNDFVDQVAQATFDYFSPALLEVHQRACDELDHGLRCHAEVMQHFSRISRLSLQTPVEHLKPPPMPIARVQPLSLADICDAAHDLPPILRWDGVDRWLQWFRSVESDDAPLRWMSWLELLLHFQQSTGIIGVRCHGKGQHRCWVRVTERDDIPMRKLAAGFGQFGMNVIRRSNDEWRAVQRKPGNHRLHLALNSIPVKVHQHVVSQVDSWLDSHGVKVKKSSSLDDIPFAV